LVKDESPERVELRVGGLPLRFCRADDFHIFKRRSRVADAVGGATSQNVGVTRDALDDATAGFRSISRAGGVLFGRRRLSLPAFVVASGR
jgi:hypothetical protein